MISIEFNDAIMHRAKHLPLYHHKLHNPNIPHTDDIDPNYLHTVHHHNHNDRGAYQLPQDPNVHQVFDHPAAFRYLPTHEANLAYTYHDRQSKNPPISIINASSILLNQ